MLHFPTSPPHPCGRCGMPFDWPSVRTERPHGWYSVAARSSSVVEIEIMELKNGGDGLPNGDGVTYELNGKPKKTGLRPGEVFNALSWEQLTGVHLVNNKAVEEISKKHSRDFLGAHRFLQHLASYPDAPKTHLQNRRGREYIADTGIGWLWNNVHWVADLHVEGVRYDAYMEALFEGLRKHSFLGPDGLVVGHNPNILIPPVVDKLNDVIADVHAAITAKGFEKRVKKQLAAREKSKKLMLEFFDALRWSRDSSRVLRMDFQYLAQDYFEPMQPTKEGFDKARADLKRLLDTIRGRVQFKGHAIHFWKLSFGYYRGWNFHVMFFFDPSYIDNIDVVARQFQEVWRNIGGNDAFSYQTAGGKNKFKSNAIGLLRQDDSDKWSSLMDTIEYWALSDQILLAKQFGRYHTFDHSEIVSWCEKLVDRSSRAVRPVALNVFSSSTKDVVLPRSSGPKSGRLAATTGSAFDIALLAKESEERGMLGERVKASVEKSKQRKIRVASTRQKNTSLKVGSLAASSSLDVYAAAELPSLDAERGPSNALASVEGPSSTNFAVSADVPPVASDGDAHPAPHQPSGHTDR